MAFVVYVLRSLKHGKRYVGYTGKSLQERLQRHTGGATPWTQANGPFELIHQEQYSEKVEAMRRERYLKSGIGREWLDRNI